MPIGEGQVQKPVFLATLRNDVSAMADEILQGIGQSSRDCPYIAHWFGHYSQQNVDHIERAIMRYAPDAARAGTWRGLVAAWSTAYATACLHISRLGRSRPYLKGCRPTCTRPRKGVPAPVQRCCSTSGVDDTTTPLLDGGRSRSGEVTLVTPESLATGMAEKGHRINTAEWNAEQSPPGTRKLRRVFQEQGSLD